MVDPFLRNGSTGGEDEKSLKGEGHSSGDTGIGCSRQHCQYEQAL